MNIYGVLDSNSCHIDVSTTERGAKCYATRHGYTSVSVRHNCGNCVTILAFKALGKWCQL